ncbi:MAG TPA: ThuA domain-containing protein [Chitinophagaceae bacterium]
MKKKIANLSSAVVLLFLFLICCSFGKKETPHILVFSKTSGWRHLSIDAGKTALIKLGNENGYIVDTTENADFFTEASLKKYSAVIFLNTTGDVLNDNQQAAFKNYIQSGGGFVGVHAATDTEHDWPWYGKLVGAYFLNHPKIQQATLNVLDTKHVSTRHLPKQWKHTDEWYNFKDISTDIKVLISIDEKSYEGGKNGYHPIAWYHEFDGGRAFYTELGHTDECYTDQLFLRHLLGGIKYAIGKHVKKKK